MTTESDESAAPARPPIDKAKAGAFMTQILGVMQGGALSLMCSVGHRTGLFDTMAGMGPATSQEIADAAGLAERPVREWLGSVTTGGIVEHDADRETFHLPPEHAGLLTRAAGTLNLANGMQFIAQLGKVEDDVVESFRTGEGVPYSRYDTFQPLMASISTQRFDTGLVQHVVPLIEADDALRTGIDVADIGCGAGHAVNVLAAAYPDSTFVGYDIAEDGIAAARAEATQRGLSNASFEVADVAEIDEEDRFDLITSFDAIHDQAHPDRVLSGIHRALKPGGRYLCVEPNASSHVAGDMDKSHAPFLYMVSTMHCMQVSLAAGGEGVGACWGEEVIRARLDRAGFGDVDLLTNPVDRTNDYYLSTKS